jgi:hypothetical protein
MDGGDGESRGPCWVVRYSSYDKTENACVLEEYSWAVGVLLHELGHLGPVLCQRVT